MTLRLNYAGCLAGRVGAKHGILERDFDSAEAEIREVTGRLRDMRERGRTRWRNLPLDPLRREHTAAVKRVVDEINGYFASSSSRGRCDNLIVLGIGGSALGNLALQSALRPLTHNLMSGESGGAVTGRTGPRVFVLDNVDPMFVGGVMRFIERDDPSLEHTLVNVISKSGETAETAAQFMIFRDWLRARLGAPRASKHIVAVTDPVSGTMRSIVDREGYLNLPVPDGVGGRFSVLSPVGLFSAAMCGIDIGALLDGAAAMDARCDDDSFAKNPAAILAWLLMRFAGAGKPNHALMPYSNSLYLLADWYRQLWAESLGKRVDLEGREVFAGATPIKALGATDQHSQVQLYREGPNDKVIGFIEVEAFDEDITIPGGLGVDALSYLERRTLGELLSAEKRATEFALLESERPTYTITLPRIDERSVGEFIQLWQVTTAYAGLLLNIDAYDQPAVETGKKATFGLMGRHGFDEWKSKVAEKLGDSTGRTV